MEVGKLYGDRYALKWLSEDQKLLLGIWATGGEKIDSRTKKQKWTIRPYISGFKCTNCQKLILDINRE